MKLAPVIAGKTCEKSWINAKINRNAPGTKECARFVILVKAANSKQLSRRPRLPKTPDRN